MTHDPCVNQKPVLLVLQDVWAGPHLTVISEGSSKRLTEAVCRIGNRAGRIRLIHFADTEGSVT
jgi:hypothetical protein